MIEAPEKKPFAWLETAAAILMAVSSLGTALCSFQVSRWGALSSEKAGNAMALERKANLQRIEAHQVMAVQVQLFLEYVSAHLAGNATLERYYTDRFPPEIKKAFDAWNTQDPFKNAGAPLHPFVPSLYEMRYAREIDEALRTSAVQAEEARVTGGISTNYLNTTVLLATVLFFVGITSRLTSPRVRLGTFCFGVILFLLAAVRVSMLPWRF